MVVDDIKVYFLMFFLYCLVGWVWESIYMSVIEKRIQNRGFLRGPYIPIYGFAGIIIHFSLRGLYAPLVSKNTIIIYVIGMVCVTCIELITANLAEKFLHRQLWDYTIYKINYQGKIALIASLFWGFAAVMFTQVLNPFIIYMFSGLAHDTKIVLITLMATLMGLDTILAFAAHSPLPAKLSKSYESVNSRWEKLLSKEQQ